MNRFKQTSDDKMSDLKKYMDGKRGTSFKKSDSGEPHLNQTIAERAFGKGPAPVLYIGGNE